MSPVVIDIWKFNLYPSDKKEWKKCWAVLSTAEKQKAQTFLRESSQQAYVMTRGLVRKIMGSYLHVDPSKISFRYTALGKPFIATSSPYYFNVAHSKNYALCAVCALADIGVDLEFMTTKRDINMLTKHVMTPEEQLEFSNLPITRQHEAFFEMWTRKEAFVKCLGKGLQYDLKNCYIGFMPCPTIFEKDRSEYKKRAWFIQDIPVDENYKAAVVLAHNSKDITLRYYNDTKLFICNRSKVIHSTTQHY